MDAKELIQRYDAGERDFKGVVLDDEQLNEQDLKGIDFEEASLAHVNFDQTCLSEANLCNADLRGVRLFESGWNDANLRGANLENADISFSSFESSNLREANLKGVKLHQVNLTRTNLQGCQPDISFYIGDRANLAPKGKSVINLDEQAIPNLVIEISNTTVNDDLGAKRLLYEEMGISEYWVVDVQSTQIYAFEIVDRGSRRIDISLILPELSIATITEALTRSKESDQSQVGQWLISQFQG